MNKKAKKRIQRAMRASAQEHGLDVNMINHLSNKWENPETFTKKIIQAKRE